MANLKNKVYVGIVSAALLSGAALWEGVRYKPYKDVGGVTTVCYGYAKNDIENREYKPEECKVLLATELIEHSKGVFNCINQPMKQNEFDAFTLFTYNIGIQGFCGSRTAKLFNEGKKVEACNAIAYTPDDKPNWAYVNGKFIQGLHNRRLYERKMCLGDGVDRST